MSITDFLVLLCVLPSSLQGLFPFLPHLIGEYSPLSQAPLTVRALMIKIIRDAFLMLNDVVIFTLSFGEPGPVSA